MVLISPAVLAKWDGVEASSESSTAARSRCTTWGRAVRGLAASGTGTGCTRAIAPRARGCGTRAPPIGRQLPHGESPGGSLGDERPPALAPRLALAAGAASVRRAGHGGHARVEAARAVMGLAGCSFPALCWRGAVWPWAARRCVHRRRPGRVRGLDGAARRSARTCCRSGSASSPGSGSAACSSRSPPCWRTGPGIGLERCRDRGCRPRPTSQCSWPR